MAKRNPDLMTASEIASYSFCPEAWRLGQELGLRPENEEQFLRGERFHARTASVERHSSAALKLGFFLLLLGVIVVGIYLFVLGSR